MRTGKFWSILVMLGMVGVFSSCGSDDDIESNEEGGTEIIDHGTANGHEWVDLGLPSGTKWATMNVGASSPSDYGNYYAWGETSTKSRYGWGNLKYCLNGDGDKFSKYVTDREYGNVDGKEELDPSDDAAYVNWGSSWRMPTKKQQDELCKKCKWTWMLIGDHEGYMVVGPNGNFLFLPAAGNLAETKSNLVGSSGYYGSRSLCLDNQRNVYQLRFSSSGPLVGTTTRKVGQSVRPVLAPYDSPDSDEETNSGTNYLGGISKGSIVTDSPINQPMNYKINGTTYEMILVEDGPLGSFYMMQTELPANAILEIDGMKFGPCDSWKDNILTTKEFQRFIQDLRKHTGWNFRMPTVEEWIFAAKGGTKSKGYKYCGSNNLNEVAWYKSNGSSPHNIATKLPNELGLYDMSGNYGELTYYENSVSGSESVDGDIYGGYWGSGESQCLPTSWTENLKDDIHVDKDSRLTHRNSCYASKETFRLIYMCPR